MSSSRPDTAATKRDVDSKENRKEFVQAREATTYDNLLLDGRISNAEVRNHYGYSGLHEIPGIGSRNKDIDTDILLFYLLTCDPPVDVNRSETIRGRIPKLQAARYNNTFVFTNNLLLKVTDAFHSEPPPFQESEKYRKVQLQGTKNCNISNDLGRQGIEERKYGNANHTILDTNMNTDDDGSDSDYSDDSD